MGGIHPLASNLQVTRYFPIYLVSYPVTILQDDIRLARAKSRREKHSGGCRPAPKCGGVILSKLPECPWLSPGDVAHGRGDRGRFTAPVVFVILDQAVCLPSRHVEAQ